MTAPLRGVKPAISYNLREAAFAVGIGERKIREAADSGAIPSHWADSRRLFRAEDLDAWVLSLPPERI